MSNTIMRPSYILPVLVISQFTGTSLWFAGNAIISDLQSQWGLLDSNVSTITSAVQFGFIFGTLLFAWLSIADRFSPRQVFFCCALLGAIANVAILISPVVYSWIIALRFMTGFFLAGIYPVGMKIASGWYRDDLGKALGYLIGALVLGTAFPHLLRGVGAELSWQYVLVVTSIMATLGGFMVLIFVPDGPFMAQKSVFNPSVIFRMFRSKLFRSSAFGYFGHMWELYAFWAFLPVWILAYNQQGSHALNVSFWSFLIIAVGSLGCIVGGMMSLKKGSASVARFQLMMSGVCCILSALFFTTSPIVMIIFLFVWGVTVIGDSPQFSTLNANNAPREYVGTALTLVNSLGYVITIVSIQILHTASTWFDMQFLFWFLIPGPLFGLWAMRGLSAQDGK